MINFDNYKEFESVVITLKEVARVTGVNLDEAIAKLDDMYDEHYAKAQEEAEWNRLTRYSQSNADWRVGK